MPAMQHSRWVALSLTLVSLAGCQLAAPLFGGIKAPLASQTASLSAEDQAFLRALTAMMAASRELPAASRELPSATSGSSAGYRAQALTAVEPQITAGFYTGPFPGAGSLPAHYQLRPAGGWLTQNPKTATSGGASTTETYYTPNGDTTSAWVDTANDKRATYVQTVAPNGTVHKELTYLYGGNTLLTVEDYQADGSDTGRVPLNGAQKGTTSWGASGQGTLALSSGTASYPASRAGLKPYPIRVASGTVLGSYAVPETANGITVDPSGNVWVANLETDSVTKLSSSGAVLGTYPAGRYPEFAISDAAGNIYLANQGGGVTKVAPDGTVVGTHYLSADDTAARPLAMAFDPQGNLWASFTARGKVAKLTPQGFQDAISCPMRSERMGIDGAGNFYVEGWDQAQNSVGIPFPRPLTA